MNASNLDQRRFQSGILGKTTGLRMIGDLKRFHGTCPSQWLTLHFALQLSDFGYANRRLLTSGSYFHVCLYKTPEAFCQYILWYEQASLPPPSSPPPSPQQRKKKKKKEKKSCNEFKYNWYVSYTSTSDSPAGRVCPDGLMTWLQTRGCNDYSTVTSDRKCVAYVCLSDRERGGGGGGGWMERQI